MANRGVFQSVKTKLATETALEQIPASDTLNLAGGQAYSFSANHQLAQLAATGCLNGTYYADADSQLSKVLELCRQCDAQTIARTAVYARSRAYMKDMPALLTAILSVKSPELFRAIFPQVIDTGKMLQNFVQIMRSGQAGRRSLGRLPKEMVRRWFESRDDDTVFRQSIGEKPSFADILRMVHPHPRHKTRAALYRYFLGKSVALEALPKLVRQVEDLRCGRSNEIPEVPFLMLTSLPLSSEQWRQIADKAGWQALRMNLNTFLRHGVFEDERLTLRLAQRLSDPAEIRKAKVFPYQLLATWHALADGVPHEIREALQDAMEIATANIPSCHGKVYVLPDVSGSMGNPITGTRRGANSKVRCVDVAALIAAAVSRTNPSAEIVPFEQDVVTLRLNPRDSILTNAARLAAVGGGGTSCSAPLSFLNRRGAIGDLVIFVSDNESWVDSHRGRGTAVLREWCEFKRRNPAARLVCIDLTPNTTTQAPERSDILNVGGFSDQVFEVINEFACGGMEAADWATHIEEAEAGS